MKLPRISLDTNVFIFGLRKIDPWASCILAHLFRFEVSISLQVERELRKNLTTTEFRTFYELIGLLSTFHISYQSPDEELLSLYRQLGLKTGDAIIAAFCEQEGIDIFISENRHFLQELPQRSFEILDSQAFCQKFLLQDSASRK